MRKWQIHYARTADATTHTDSAVVTTKQLKRMKTLSWIKIFKTEEVPNTAKTGLLYSEFELSDAFAG